MCSHLASPVMLNKIPQSSLKLRLHVFRQNWIHLSPKFKWVETGVLMVTWMYWSKIATIVYGWITIILLSTKSPGNHFCIFRPHYVIFPTLLQVWTVVFKNGMIKPQLALLFWYIPYVAYVREYSLTKTYTLILKFPVKSKIFQRKKT